MKRLFSVLLTLTMLLPLAACGRSAEANACINLISAIGDVTDFNSFQPVYEARSAYDLLSDEDKMDVNVSVLEDAERKLFSLPFSPAEACKALKDNMKDPSSFRIYGDVILVHFKDPDSKSELYITCVECDGKNSYGAYAGKSAYEIICAPDGTVAQISDEEDDGFWGLASKYYSGAITEAEYQDRGFYFCMVNGEKISEIINCEFYD